ncbi:MAG TPA: PHP domain-containing protein, partial [Prolixibacteraceae bacterium]|nr:PHP domain-containing protein [Prolixibacteraceae bacterium]
MYLNAHSYYSLRYGTLSIDQLLDLSEANGVSVLALTDINTTMGIPEFVKKAKEKNIKPIAGVEIRDEDELLFVGIAINREGFKELNDYISWHNLNKKKFILDRIRFKQVLLLYPWGQKKASELFD